MKERIKGIKGPIKLKRHPESLGIFSRDGTVLAYIYFEDNFSRRETLRRLDSRTAMKLAQRLARFIQDELTEREG